MATDQSAAGGVGHTGAGRARRVATPAQVYAAAVALHRQRRLEEAEAAYRALLRLAPDHAGALHRLGVLCKATGRLDEAILLLTRAVDKDPASAAAHNDLGVVLSARQRPQDALAHYARAAELAPAFAEAHNNLGNALLQLDRHEEAVASFERALAVRHDFAEAHNNLGNALAALGRQAEAIAHYDHAAMLKPALIEAHLNAGIALAAIERLERAIARYQRALALQPEHPDAHAGLGKALAGLQRHGKSLRHFERALAARPDWPDGHNRVGNALAALARYEEAIVHYRKAIELRPELFGARNNLGNALVALDRHEEAIEHFHGALGGMPQEAAELSRQTYNRLGGALMALRRTEEAKACFEKVLVLGGDIAEPAPDLGGAPTAVARPDDAIVHAGPALAAKPDFARAHSNLGSALIDLNRPEEALASFDRALAIDPRLVGAHHGIGIAQLTLGRLDESRRAFERAIEIDPLSFESHRSLAEAKQFAPDDPQLEALERAARDLDALTADQQINLHFALASAYANLRRHELSFRHLLAGNALKRSQTEYDEAVTLGKLARSRAAFTPELVGRLRGLGDPSRRPIFIVGMPRSGTTLVEQVLASHSQVFGAGELEHFSGAAGSVCEPPGATVPYPEMLATITGERLRALGTRYLASASAVAPRAAAAERITDKLPANFRLVGLIHLALPNARIIHVRRDPLDTCFSCFSKLFAGELAFTYDLGELGRHYRAYEALMAHWRTILPPGAMLEVQYEALIADFEPQARRLLAHCGLDWDDACLAFHQTQRPVRTASAAQVRQPIYRSSVGRWRPYEVWLGPLREALGERLEGALQGHFHK